MAPRTERVGMARWVWEAGTGDMELGWGGIVAMEARMGVDLEARMGLVQAMKKREKNKHTH